MRYNRCDGCVRIRTNYRAQIEALRTSGFVVVDEVLTDAGLDTFEPLVTAAAAYRSAGDERTLEERLTAHGAG
jgi:hypothetical protein